MDTDYKKLSPIRRVCYVIKLYGTFIPLMYLLLAINAVLAVIEECERTEKAVKDSLKWFNAVYVLNEVQAVFTTNIQAIGTNSDRLYNHLDTQYFKSQAAW